MGNVNEEDLIRLTGYVISSSYRKKVLESIGFMLKTPTLISNDTKIRINHLSQVFKQLKDEKLIICVNETAKKGRMYRLTDLGIAVWKQIEIMEKL